MGRRNGEEEGTNKVMKMKKMMIKIMMKMMKKMVGTRDEENAGS